jgi:hypothetical protein
MMYEVGVIRDGREVMLHYNRNTPEQAREEGGQHGRVTFCRKVNRDRILGIGLIEHMRIEPTRVMVKNSPYKSAVAMDEMIGQKRNNRRNNLYKDKENT